MRSDPSTRAGEADETAPARRIVTERLPTALTLLVAAIALVGVSVAVEESDGGLGAETPGFGIGGGGLAVLVVALVARRQE